MWAIVVDEGAMDDLGVPHHPDDSISDTIVYLQLVDPPIPEQISRRQRLSNR